MQENLTPAGDVQQDQVDAGRMEVETEEVKSGIQWRRVLPRVATILSVIGITLAVVFLSDRISQFADYGLLGVFVVSLLGNATVILPAPSLAIVFAMGGTLPPLHVGLVAGVGEALGELTGYVAGYAGSAVIVHRKRYELIQGYMQEYGLVTIFVLSVIPNPFFDLAGIAAGTMRIPVWQFLAACWAGKTVKTIAIAFAGAGSITFLSRMVEGLMN